MSNQYTLYLAGFGFSDQYLNYSCLNLTKVYKKGDIWKARRTEETYDENFFKYRVEVIYEEGFEVACDKIIQELKCNFCLAKVVANCTYVELQVITSVDEDFRVPSIHFRVDQLVFLAQHRIEIDASIS